MDPLAKVRPYAKAVVAFITPGVAGLLAAVQDASPGGASVTGPEWVGIVAACILTSGAVYATPNRSTIVPTGYVSGVRRPIGKHRDEDGDGIADSQQV